MEETGARNNTAHYMPQLDGLRAFAVGAVLIHHFFRLPRIGGVDFALLGVWLFFVLSGFLITGILLRSRDQVDCSGYPSGFVLRQFYIRRFLRIFPLYYSVLFLAATIDLGDVRATIFWHLAYMSNYLFATHQYWGPVTAHFWSLSVEEQFYILWPALILFAPRRLLLKLVISAIAIGPIFRLAAHFLDFNWIARMTVLPASLDALGLGALLAYCSHYAGEKPILIKRLKQCIYWLGVPGLIVLLGLQKLETYKLVSHVTQNSWFIEPILWALLFVWIINRASSGFTGIGAKILELKPLVYTGKISYGIYVYHPFIYFLVPILFSQINIDFFRLPRGIQFGLLVGITVGIAAISWHFFENPLNSLKNQFTYGEQKARQGTRGLTLCAFKSQTESQRPHLPGLNGLR
jgi:peptidoglycan/LPS O-acetylase OafA/YrhL